LSGTVATPFLSPRRNRDWETANNGGKGWNQTVPGSFCAKNPENDFTFVFNSKDDALRYAQHSFKNSEYIKE